MRFQSGRHDSNVRPPAPKAGALARLSYAPRSHKTFTVLLRRKFSYQIEFWVDGFGRFSAGTLGSGGLVATHQALQPLKLFGAGEMDSDFSTSFGGFADFDFGAQLHFQVLL